MMDLRAMASVFGVWRSARKAGRGWKDRAAFERHQRQRRDAWLVRWGHAWEDMQVVDKAWTARHFARLNKAGLSHEEARACADTTGACKGFAVGGSTGTSGTRGFYVLSLADRLKWVAAMVGLCRPGFGERVAVILPRSSALYDAAGGSRLIQVRVFNAAQPPESWAGDLGAFAPHHIVAPPRVWRWLIEQGRLPASVRKGWTAGERCDAHDMALMRAHLPQVGQIYMATEGLMAVSCAHGRLHLCEDSTFFEFEDAGHGLVRPIITGFAREAQCMVRYRMTDLLRLAPDPCPCGSVHQGVEEVVGREDDMLALDGLDGQVVWVPPSAVRDALVRVLPDGQDFRVHQTGPSRVEITTRPLDGDLRARLLADVAEVCARFHAAPVLEHRTDALAYDPARKLSRVQGWRRPQGEGDR